MEKISKNTKKAFTLSEVLITLTVLGIIAAITIPTLSAAAQKHGFATSVKKFHSNLSNAVANYMAINDYTTLSNSPLEQEDENEEATGQEAVNQFIRDNFKVTKECTRNNANECFGNTYKSVSGNNTKTAAQIITDRAMVLADGSVVSIEARGDRYMYVHVDINGKKGPNVGGYDMWEMSIYYNGSIGEESPGSDRDADFLGMCKDKAYGGGCFSQLKKNDWVIDW